MIRRALMDGGGVPAIQDLAFTLNRYRAGPYTFATPDALSSWSFTRASTKTALDGVGNVVSFASGVPAITDLGFLIEAASTNLLLNSGDMTGAGWSVLGTASVTATTVTDNDAAAAASALQDVAVANDGATYTLSWFIAKNQANIVAVQAQLFGGTGINYAVAVDTATGLFTTASSAGSSPAGFTVIDAGVSGWRVSVSITNNTTGNTALRRRFYPAYASVLSGSGLGVNTPQVVSLTGTATVRFQQNEPGTSASSYIPTTSAAVTRAADVASLSGLTGAAAAFFQTYGVAGGANPRLFQYDGGANAYFVSPTVVELTNNTVVADGTIGGAGTQSGVVKTALGFDASGMTVIANGGTQGTNAAAWAANTGNLTLGNNPGATRALNGYVQRMLFGATKGQFDGMTQ